MPSEWLGAGEGGAQGLETLLTRMLLEQRQAEVERRNRAEEDLAGRRITEDSALRQQNQDYLNQWRTNTLEERKTQDEANRENQIRDDVRTSALLRPIGSTVTPEEQAKDVKYGVPRASFDYQPPSEGLSTPEGEKGPTPELFKWRGTQDQIERQKAREERDTSTSNQLHTVQITDPEIAKALGVKVGTPVDANYDPKSKQLTYRGIDITQGYGHYEKPPSPDRVLIQTGEGYMPRDKARQVLRGGGQVPLATTSTTRTMQEGASMLAPHVKDLGQQAEALDQAGAFGPVMSRIRHLAERAGSVDDFMGALTSDPELQKDRAVGRFATSLGLLATGAARVHGGARGGGSPQMLEHFKSLLKDSSTLEMFLGRLDAVDDYMTGYAAGPGGGTGAGATDIYQEYLNRTKKKP